MKDHEISLLVNELTAIAQEYGQAVQLRSRISQALHRALQPREGLPVQIGEESRERELFAAFMVAQGFGEQVVAPPKPPLKHYRSSHVEACWEAWAGCLKVHNLNANKTEGGVLSEEGAMKGTYLGYAPDLGKEFMERQGGAFILAHSKSPTSASSGTPSQPGPFDPNAQETEEDSIRAGIQRMLKVIHDEEQGRLRSIDQSLPVEVQDKLRKEIKEHAQVRRSRVLKK